MGLAAISIGWQTDSCRSSSGCSGIRFVTAMAVGVMACENPRR